MTARTAGDEPPGAGGPRPLVVGVEVRWADCDPAGIAYYPHFFEWMDLAAHALAREMGISRDDMLPPSRHGLPLVAARAEFLAPARLDDALEVRTWVARIGRTSLGLRHEIHRVSGATALLARGTEDRVYIIPDVHGALRPRELTPGMRAALGNHADPPPRGQ